MWLIRVRIFRSFERNWRMEGDTAAMEIIRREIESKPNKVMLLLLFTIHSF